MMKSRYSDRLQTRSGIPYKALIHQGITASGVHRYQDKLLPQGIYSVSYTHLTLPTN